LVVEGERPTIFQALDVCRPDRLEGYALAIRQRQRPAFAVLQVKEDAFRCEGEVVDRVGDACKGPQRAIEGFGAIDRIAAQEHEAAAEAHWNAIHHREGMLRYVCSNAGRPTPSDDA
jgi:hypothetical protein